MLAKLLTLSEHVERQDPAVCVEAVSLIQTDLRSLVCLLDVDSEFCIKPSQEIHPELTVILHALDPLRLCQLQRVDRSRLRLQERLCLHVLKNFDLAAEKLIKNALKLFVRL